MKSMELQLYTLLKEGGVHEPQAKQIAELLRNSSDHSEIHADLKGVQDVMNSGFSEVNKNIAVLASQMKMLQWLFGAVGFTIIIFIFTELASR